MTILPKYSNLARWSKWIDEVTGIDYAKIQVFQQKKVGKIKDVITKLTASKDLIGAVRCGLQDKVKSILEKDVTESTTYFIYSH